MLDFSCTLPTPPFTALTTRPSSICKLTDRTKDMEDEYAEVYGGRGEPGFASFPPEAGRLMPAARSFCIQSVLNRWTGGFHERYQTRSAQLSHTHISNDLIITHISNDLIT
jgi:hypothetical protein